MTLWVKMGIIPKLIGINTESARTGRQGYYGIYDKNKNRKVKNNAGKEEHFDL